MATKATFKLMNTLKKFPTNLQNPIGNYAFLTQRSYNKASQQERERKPRNNLYSRISPLGDPDVSLKPVLDEWVEQGKRVKYLELQHIVRTLRARNRFTHALEVSEWMSSIGLTPFGSGARAVQLDLIGRVHGADFAESHFNKMNDKDKNEKMYGALLNCYVREGLVEKASAHLQKMKELNFVTTPLTYNGIMCLYQNARQFKKIPDVLSEMKNSGISPDLFSYRICLNIYGAQSDIDNMEKILEEMKSSPHISIDWITYAVVASHYIKAGLNDKAVMYLKKAEEKIDKEALGYNNLISLYASLGKKDEMIRLWHLAKSKCKKQLNRDYITMLGSLVKIGELEEAEKILDEWEASHQFCDFRVPNVLLIGYCQKGLIEKAEAKLKEIVSKGKIPIPNSWSIIAAAYTDKQDMEKAYKCMKKALSVENANKRWRPKNNVVLSVVDWLGDNKDYDEVEDFLSLVKGRVPVDRKMYHALLKAYIRNGKEVEKVLENMKTDNIHVNEETQKILSTRLSEH